MERLTLEEAAKKLGIPKEAARNRVKRGTLPSTTDSGGQVYVCVSTETGAGTASDAHAGQPNNPSGGRYPLWYFAPEESSHHAPLFSSDDTHRWEFRRPPEPPTRGGVQGWWDWLRRRPAFRGKTGWDWAELLLVPLLLTLATIVFAFVQDRRQDYIANQRTQDSTLQAYLSQMSDLMIDEHGTELRKLDPDAEVRALMRARTSTVLRNLDGNRNLSIVRFLAEGDLIGGKNPVISFVDANLSNAQLRKVDLSGIDLAGAHLTGAYLY